MRNPTPAPSRVLAAFLLVVAGTAVLAGTAQGSVAGLTDCRFSRAQVFDVQWSISGSTLNVSNMTRPFASNEPRAGQLSAGELGEDDSFAFFENGASVGFRQFDADGELKYTLHLTGTFRAIGPDFIFYIGNGFYGTLITSGEGFKYGDSASLGITAQNVSAADALSYTSCVAQPLAIGQTRAAVIEASSGSPATAPGAPTVGTATLTTTTLSLPFTAPDDGGSPITNYEYTLDGGDTWTPRDPTSTDSPLELTGLTPGATYTIGLRAINDVGPGLAITSGPHTLLPVPLPPPVPQASSGPSPVTEPGGGVPVVAPGGSSGSVGGVPVVPTPSRPSGGSAQFRVGTVETRVDVASSGAGAVGGSDGAPAIRAVRDRVAAITGAGMRPGDIAEVWMPLPNGDSRQVALLPIAADGTFDGALPFTGELDGHGPLPIGDRTIQLFGRDADGQLTVINFGVRIEQPAPIAPEPDRGRGAVPTLMPGQSLATNAGLPTPVTVTPLPDVRSTRIEGDDWLMDVDVPDGEVREDGGAPLIEIVNGTDSVVRGTGFLPGTRAYVWLMSDPTFLGEVTVNADGSFSGSVPIAGVEPGEHTLQLSGVGTDGYIRAANLGVVLVGDGMPRPTRVPAGEGPLQVPGAALLWALGLAGTAFLVRSRVARGAR